MVETSAQQRYRADAHLLAEIGGHVAAQSAPVTVRLPRALADAAVRAWQRDETGPPGPESGEQAYVRAFAASLALIGLVIDETGDVQVTLDPVRAAAAVFAHECAADGLLGGQPAGETRPLS